jgi:hypothetical protein
MRCFPSWLGAATSSRSAIMSTIGTISAGRTRWRRLTTPSGRSSGKAFGKREVYTPQAVVNGRIHVKGGKRGAVKAAVSELERTGSGMSVDLNVTRTGESVVIDAAAAPGGTGDAHLVLVHFDPMKSVAIERGENKGKTLSYANPVTRIQTAGMWHGKAARFELPRSEINKGGGCAILLQQVSKDGLPGPILGAAVVKPEATGR